VNIISRNAITYYTQKYPKAKNQLLGWYQEIIKQNFESFNELKAVYGNASIVNNQRVVFNIKGNDFRLVVAMNFRRKAGYVIWFGTHKEYDKIDVATVDFNLN
jgi:mRNA interferase HigB